MQLPGDQVVHSGLRTSFVYFDRLLASLARRQFDGYVQLDAPALTGTVFFAQGQICGYRAEDDPEEWWGDDAARRIALAAAEDSGSISVVAAPRALMRLWSATAGRRALYKGLSTEFVDLARLVETLARDGHTGYVEAVLKQGRSHGYLFLEDGEVIDAVLADGSHAGSGLGLVATILKAADTGEALLHVWTIGEAACAQGEHSGDGAVDLDADKDTDQPVARNVEELADVAGPSPAEVREPAPDPEGLAETWGAILGAVEHAVDDASESGRFGQALRDVQLDRAPDYPYMDPFAAEFEYASGRVYFHSPPPADFSRAMGDCLGDAIARVSFRLRKVDLETLIHRELEAVLSAHHEAIARHGIDRAATSFLAA